MTVFKEDLYGKNIDNDDANFVDEGYASPPTGHWNLFSSSHKIPSKKYLQNYDLIKWNCKKCNKGDCQCSK